MKLAACFLFAHLAIGQTLLSGVLVSGGSGGGGTVATPADSNGGGCSGASPTWTACSGTVTVTLTDATGGATICYRNDGTNPAATTPGTCDGGSTTYSGTFNLTTTTTVKALGTKVGSTNSSILSSSYTFSSSFTDTVISSLGTISDGTSNGQERHLVYDGTRWWAFYRKSGTADTMFYNYSTDLITWGTETSTSLNPTASTKGRSMDIYFQNVSGSLVVLASHTVIEAGPSNDQPFYRRGVISGTTITWSSILGGNNSTLANNGDPQNWAVDTNSIVHWFYNSAGGNGVASKSTNVISSTFADLNGQWSNPAWISVVASFTASQIIPIGSGDMIEFAGDTNRVLSRFSTSGTYGGNTSFTSEDPTQWTAAKFTNSDVRLIMTDASTTFTCQTWNGSTWSASATCPTWPTNGIATNSQVSSYCDGTNWYVAVVRGDSNKTVATNKYNGTSWGGWVDLSSGAGTGARAWAQVTAQDNGSYLGVTWSEANSSNFDYHVKGIAK